MLNHWQEGPHYIGTHHYRQVGKKTSREGEREREMSFPSEVGRAKPEQGLRFHVSSLGFLGSSSLMSRAITYHSPAAAVTRPPTRRGHRGSRWVGKSVERRALPLSDAGLRVSQWSPHQRLLLPQNWVLMCVWGAVYEVGEAQKPATFEPSSL